MRVSAFQQRIILLVSGLAVTLGAVQWVKSGYNFRVLAPRVDLAEVSYTLGDWRGEDVPIHDATVRVMHAHSHLNRLYHDGVGRTVSLHAAIWASPDEVGEAAPHHPEVCYPAAGWEIMERRRTTLALDDRQIPLELIHFQGRDQSVVTAHCYQFGEHYLLNASEGRAVFYELWGEREWPPTIKILLQTPAENIEAASRRLTEMAREVLRDFQRQRDASSSAMNVALGQKA